jgi:hypothetical protein
MASLATVFPAFPPIRSLRNRQIVCNLGPFYRLIVDACRRRQENHIKPGTPKWLIH